MESYRRIRNTLRFLLANVADFDFSTQAVALQDMLEIDQYAIAFSASLQREIEADFSRYEFHPVVSKVQTYCSEFLGAFYLDILKDRLYTCAADSIERRSAQTALHQITDALLRILAPMVSFTAEEAWAIFQPKKWREQGETIFTQTWYQWPVLAQATELIEKWAQIREWRAEVQKRLEDARTAGAIGSSLQAEIEVKANDQQFRNLASLGDDLKYVSITSSVRLQRDTDSPVAGSPDITSNSGQGHIAVKASTEKKCDRCWHYRADVGQDSAHPMICMRCSSNLFGGGDRRRFA